MRVDGWKVMHFCMKSLTQAAVLCAILKTYYWYYWLTFFRVYFMYGLAYKREINRKLGQLCLKQCYKQNRFITQKIPIPGQKTARKIQEKMFPLYKDVCILHDTVKWTSYFQTGHCSVQDEPRSIRLFTADNASSVARVKVWFWLSHTGA